jgi:hypothetical protein
MLHDRTYQPLYRYRCVTAFGKSLISLSLGWRETMGTDGSRAGGFDGENREDGAATDLLRRSLLQCATGAALTGASATGGLLAADARGRSVDGDSTGRSAGGDARTWMSDEVPETPLHDLCLPGTHHAAMHGCGANYWWHTQDATMGQQLADGIRYLDIRPGVYYEQQTLVDAGVADQLVSEWGALIDEAGGVANLVPGIGDQVDDSLIALIETLVSFDDPDWVAEKYVQSCADGAGSDPVLPIDALIVRVLASLFAQFDVPDYGLDLDTLRLDRPATVTAERDGFRAHHGGNLARPYDWGVSLSTGFARVHDYLDAVAQEGASEIVILQAKQFWDLLDRTLGTDDWQAFADLLDTTLGPYILDLSAYTPAEFAALRPADFDRPQIAVLLDGPEPSVWTPPAWAGDLSYLTNHFPGETQPGNVLGYAAGHTDGRPHDSERLDRVEFQVTPDTQTVVDVTIEVVDIRTEYDSRLLYSNLLEAARRTNALLGSYIGTVRRDPAQNPNIISLDFYERSDLVAHCRALSREGVIDGDVLADPPVPDAEYRLTSADSNRAVAVAGEEPVMEVRATETRQAFRLVPNDDSTYRIKHPEGSSVLGVAGGTDNGDAVVLADWDGSASQRWFPVNLDAGEYALVSAHSGLALDAASDYDGYDDGTVLQWHFHAGANQRWLLEPLASEPPAVAGSVPPQDRDGDGLYEDVRGDGQFDVADVQALFDALDTAAVQDNAARYRFHDGTDEVTVLDVQALFNRLE